VAALGLGVVVVGLYQEMLHVAPGYGGTIRTGWGGDLAHGERLLAWLGVVAVGGTVAATRLKYLAAVPVAVGGVVLVYAGRAVLGYVRDPGLYTPVRTYGGETTRFVLGAEPFLLVAGGGLLVVAGVAGWRAHAGRAGAETATDPSAA
jgi:hypothetical protein